MQLQAAWKFLFFSSLYFPLPVPFFITYLFLLLENSYWVTSAKVTEQEILKILSFVRNNEKTGKNGQNPFLKTVKVNQRSSALQEAFSQ